VLVESDEAYQRAERQALDLLDRVFPWAVWFNAPETNGTSDKVCGLHA